MQKWQHFIAGRTFGSWPPFYDGTQRPRFTTVDLDWLWNTTIIIRIHVLVAVRFTKLLLLNDYAIGEWISYYPFWYTSGGKSDSRSRVVNYVNLSMGLLRQFLFCIQTLRREIMKEMTSRDYQQMKAKLDALYKTNLISFSEWYATFMTIRRHFGLVTAS